MTFNPYPVPFDPRPALVVDLQRKGRRLAEWQASKDACEICQELDGEIVDASIDVEEVAHPNCQCELIPVEEEDE